MLNLCVLNMIKQMDLLELMMELDIYYYFEVKNMILFTAELDILLAYKMVLHMLFLTIMQRSK